MALGHWPNGNAQCECQWSNADANGSMPLPRPTDYLISSSYHYFINSLTCINELDAPNDQELVHQSAYINEVIKDVLASGPAVKRRSVLLFASESARMAQ